MQERVPSLESIVFLDPRGMRKYGHGHMHKYDDVVEMGRKSDHKAEREKRSQALDGASTCVMLYTSGTTGRPKGVVLSNDNILLTAKASAEFDKLSETDSILAYLPMAWVGDFIFSMGQAYWCGFCVNCPESRETMYENLHEIGPTYFFAPPRYFEERLTILTIRMEDASRFKRWLFNRAMSFAKEVGPAILDGKDVGTWNRFKYWLGNLFIYGPVRSRAGMSRVRVAYTAGEAIGPEIFDFWRSLGINLKQPLRPDRGQRLHHPAEGRRGPSRHRGHADPGGGDPDRRERRGVLPLAGRVPALLQERTEHRIHQGRGGLGRDGGCRFHRAETGQLRIIDRAKDVGKMADGSMFAPKYVENKLKFYPNILEAVVFGAGRDKCCAFINIDLTAVGNWAERNNIAYGSYQELAGHPQVYAMIQSHVEEVNESVAQDEMLSGCQIHRFVVLHKQLDADDGELTRTQKVRRRIIEEKYGDIIAALYDGSEKVSTETEVTYEAGARDRSARRWRSGMPGWCRWVPNWRRNEWLRRGVSIFGTKLGAGRCAWIFEFLLGAAFWFGLVYVLSEVVQVQPGERPPPLLFGHVLRHSLRAGDALLPAGRTRTSQPS